MIDPHTYTLRLHNHVQDAHMDWPCQSEAHMREVMEDFKPDCTDIDVWIDGALAESWTEFQGEWKLCRALITDECRA